MSIDGMKNKVLVIGAGRIAQGFDSPDNNFVQTHVKGYKQFSETFSVDTIYDLDHKLVKSAAELWSIPNYTTDFESIRSQHFDVISICSPDDTHAYYFRVALEMEPKVIFLEKPIGLDFQQASEMFRKCQEKEILVLVNYSRLYIPEFSSIGRNIGNDEAVLSCDIKYHKGFNHNCSHLISLLSLWLNFEVQKAIIFDSFNDYSADDLSISAKAWVTRKEGQQFILNINAYPENLANVLEVDIMTSKRRVQYVESEGSKISFFNLKSYMNGIELKEYIHEKTIQVDYNLAMVNAVGYIKRFLEGENDSQLKELQHTFLNSLKHMETIRNGHNIQSLDN